MRSTACALSARLAALRAAHVPGDRPGLLVVRERAELLLARLQRVRRAAARRARTCRRSRWTAATACRCRRSSPGARGFAAPGSGGSRFRSAATGSPPSCPSIVPLSPGVAVPSKSSVLPFTQLTSPVSGRDPSARASSFKPQLAPEVALRVREVHELARLLHVERGAGRPSACGAVVEGRAGAGRRRGRRAEAGVRGLQVIAAGDRRLGLPVLARAHHEDRDHGRRPPRGTRSRPPCRLPDADFGTSPSSFESTSSLWRTGASRNTASAAHRLRVKPRPPVTPAVRWPEVGRSRYGRL